MARRDHRPFRTTRSRRVRLRRRPLEPAPVGSGGAEGEPARGDGLSAEAAYEVVLSSAERCATRLRSDRIRPRGPDRHARRNPQLVPGRSTRSAPRATTTAPTSPTMRRSNSEAHSPFSTPSSGSSSTALATRPPLVSSGSSTERSRMSAKLLDRVLETPIAPSFTRIGAIVRSRTEHWTDLDDFDLTGRTILLTGATSAWPCRSPSPRRARRHAARRRPQSGQDRRRLRSPPPRPERPHPLYADLGDLAAVARSPPR